MTIACSLWVPPTFITPPSADEAALIEETGRKLKEFLATANGDILVRIQTQNEPEQTIHIPLWAFQALANILTEVGSGRGVTLTPMNAELNTDEAARVLKVSRPFLVGLLEQGEIPFRKVGTHTRIRYEDLMVYKEKTRQNRLKALEELSALDQELGLD